MELDLNFKIVYNDKILMYSRRFDFNAEICVGSSQLKRKKNCCFGSNLSSEIMPEVKTKTNLSVKHLCNPGDRSFTGDLL